jgi:hypothetical protein
VPPLEEKAKGLAAEDALTQARCAFILRHGHYADGTVHHWTPKGITKGDLWQQTENRALGAVRRAFISSYSYKPKIGTVQHWASGGGI